MRYAPTPVEGSLIVSLELREDERGFFARMLDSDEFSANGMESVFPQINTSMSKAAGTLRGLHYQIAPRGEAKLIRCIRGAIYDVVVDMRASSPTFLRWHGVELSAENRTMLYVPKGCAHGFMTLVDESEVLYPASALYSGPHERALRWNDSAICIHWPREPSVISEKDRNARDFDINFHLSGY